MNITEYDSTEDSSSESSSDISYYSEDSSDSRSVDSNGVIDDSSDDEYDEASIIEYLKIIFNENSYCLYNKFCQNRMDWDLSFDSIDENYIDFITDEVIQDLEFGKYEVYRFIKNIAKRLKYYCLTKENIMFYLKSYFYIFGTEYYKYINASNDLKNTFEFIKCNNKQFEETVLKYYSFIKRRGYFGFEYYMRYVRKQYTIPKDNGILEMSTFLNSEPILQVMFNGFISYIGTYNIFKRGVVEQQNLMKNYILIKEFSKMDLCEDIGTVIVEYLIYILTGCGYKGPDTSIRNSSRGNHYNNTSFKEKLK